MAASLNGAASVSNLTVRINKATDNAGQPATALNWKTALTFVVDPGQSLTPAETLPIDYTSEIVSFAAVLDINLFDIVHIVANFGTTQKTIDVDTDGNGTADFVAVTLTTYAVSIDPLADPEQFITITVGGIGVKITSGNVVIATLCSAGWNELHRGARRPCGRRTPRPAGHLTVHLYGVGFEFNTRKPPTPSATPLPALNWKTALDLDRNGSFGD